MILTQETKNFIAGQIENTELYEDVSKDNELEVQVGGVTIYVTYDVFARFHEEQMYHSEVPYNCYEDLSYYEFDGAEITNIEAYDENDEEVEIENLSEVEYYA